ncbi:exosortase-associated protein EpsI, V-type [Sphingopyxis sp.]|uniref:exosortase-associated protein EpsI, V-type n=1 Tax=Sphingopyxis sp. TaxID=1908224 RepID=UPI001D2ADC9B|nr:exosortase-associated protein EpsI, V-type [Sphingopyxis sp.]MBW8295244.1 EpsI family protein [Sphingopyxis sp.]
MAEPSKSPVTFDISRRNMLLGVVLGGASAVAFARQPAIANPKIPEKRFEEWVPKSFGAWDEVSQSGVILPPPDALSDRLYDNLITRVYVAPDLPPVMLLLAYNNAQDGVLQVHRPEFCYPVGGFQLTPTRDIMIEASNRSVPANFFTATAPNRVEQVAYFTRLGSAYPRKWSEQRIAVMRANLAGEVPDGMMMRVSVLGFDPREAQGLLTGFARQFIENSNPRMQRLLLGPEARG